MYAILFGYVLGTMQVVIIDWWNRRTEHRRQLRALRAELRRISTFDARFDISDDGLRIESDYIPNVPVVNPRFLDLAMEMDFRLSDEHEDDNAQEGILDISTGCEFLQHHANEVRRRLELLKQTEDESRKKELRDEMVSLATHFNKHKDIQDATVESALSDVTRRMKEIRLWRQLNRPLGKLPKGVNPPPLRPGDPRLRQLDRNVT